MEITLVLHSGSSRVLTNLYSLVLQGSPQTEHGIYVPRPLPLRCAPAQISGHSHGGFHSHGDFMENPKQKWRI